MKKLFLLLTVFCVTVGAQQWTGILDPTRAIDWGTYTGIPTGIPSGTWPSCTSAQAGTTVPIPSSASATTIQAALTACHSAVSSGVVLPLASGTFALTGNLSIPSNTALRGNGANLTILNFTGPTTLINMGTASIYGTAGTAINSGATYNSQSITLASTSGMAVGGYLMISELNNSAFVNSTGASSNCTWCDSGYGGTRVRGQIVEITSLSGTTVGISPPLYTAYTLTPTAVYFPASAKYAGVENLQVYDNSSSANPGANIHMSECAYCWVSGIESNYAGSGSSADHIDVDFSFRGEIASSYFSNAYVHGQGQSDSEVDLRNKTSGFRVYNNIFERLHVSILTEWGAAGNVIAYNFSHGAFDIGSLSPNVVMGDFLMNHGAHPQFNLWEGNVGAELSDDIWWGTSSWATLFRNWGWGTTDICGMSNPNTSSSSQLQAWEGRQTPVNCSFFYQPFQAAWPIQIAWGNNYNNLVGNVIGSSLHQGLTGSKVAYCLYGSCTRAYSGTNYDHSFGFGTPGDTGGGSGDSTLPYTSSFFHGEYSQADGSVIWAQGVTNPSAQNNLAGHMLPASFYLSSQPSWWRSGIPWPPIGPDVTGGTGAAGITASTYAYRIPALDAYLALGGTIGAANTPLNNFNAATLYSGTVPVIVTPGLLNFGNQATGTTSASQTITVTNNQSSTLTGIAISIVGTNLGDFSQSNTCGTSLGSNVSCTITVGFTPSAAGARSATVQIVDSASTSPQTVSLAGTGTTSAPSTGYSPPALTFGNQNVSTSSASQAVTLTNNGSASLTVTSIAMTTGTSFSIASTTPPCTTGCTVAVNGTVTINIVFTPAATGSLTDSIKVISNAGSSPDTINVSGTGVDPTTVTVVQIATCAQNTGLSWPGTCALPNPATAGDVIVATFDTWNNAGTSGNLTSIVDDKGDNLVQFPGARSISTLSGSGYWNDIWYLGSVTGGAQVFTVTPNTTVTGDTFLLELRNVNTPDIGAVLNSQAATTSPSGAAVTTTGNKGIVIGFLHPAPGGTPTATGGGFTSASIADGMALSYLVTSATGTYAPAWTTPSATYAASTAAFKFVSGGAPQVSLNLTTLLFSGLQITNTAAPSLTMQLTNIGTGPLTISSIGITGINSGDFSVTSTCPISPSTLAASASCNATVLYKPQGAGARTANLTFTTNATPGTNNVELDGTAVLQPTSFGSAVKAPGVR